jgi:hypothetical protein
MAAGSTYTPIATYTTANSTTATINFNSISGAYTDLILIVSAGETTAAGGFYCVINSDTSTIYSYTQIYGTGSAAASNRASGESSLNLFGVQSGTNARGSNISHFMNYSNTTTYKTILSRGNNDGFVTGRVLLYRNTTAISSLTLTAQGTYFSTGSTFTLYGIFAA